MVPHASDYVAWHFSPMLPSLVEVRYDGGEEMVAILHAGKIPAMNYLML